MIIDAQPVTADRIPAGPLPRDRRSLAPDLARGSVLLFIALANVSLYLFGRDTGPGDRPVDGSTLDRALDLVVSLFVDGRSYPMFAALFGYGMWQMAHRSELAGRTWPQARRLIARRNTWLIVFGLLHSALLFGGDILAPYGAVGLVVLLLLARPTRTVAWWTAGILLLTVGVYVALTVALAGQDVLTSESTNYLASALRRLLTSVAGTVIAVPLLMAPVLAGVLIGRAGWLDRPWDHLSVLRRVAVGGLLVSVLGGLPYALAVGGAVDLQGTALTVADALHSLSGMAGGIGLVAVFALVAVALQHRPRTGAVGALAAVGERSLSSYLLQSVMLAPLLAPWALGLGGELGTAQAYLLAATVWAVTVVVAVLLARGGRRGPAEVALRRLTYGRPTTPVSSR